MSQRTAEQMKGGAGIGGIRKGAAVNGLRFLTPEPVVTAGRSVLRGYGVGTSTLRPLPDFLVIGAKKGGTTSVANWLARHPNVLHTFPRVQRAKSPHYFDINYSRGERWYRSHFYTHTYRRVQQRRTGVWPLTGESSPYYLFHPAAPQRIRETVPEAKLIAVLREPVSRAYSNYWDRRATGFEDLPTFEQAVDAEAERLASVTEESLLAPGSYSFDHDHHTYLARGRYAEQLRRYLDIFDRQQLLILSADAMQRDPSGQFAVIQSFLGLPVVQMELPLLNVRSGNPPLNPETRDRLGAYFAPLNQELYELLGENFGW